MTDTHPDPSSDEAKAVEDGLTYLIANDLERAIANLGYLVGMGMAPKPEICEHAAREIIARIQPKALQLLAGRQSIASGEGELGRLKVALGRLADDQLGSVTTMRRYAHRVLLGDDPQMQDIPLLDEATSPRVPLASGEGVGVEPSLGSSQGEALSQLLALSAKATPGPWIRLHDEQKTTAAVVLSGDDKLKGAHVEEVGHTNKCQCGQVWSLAVDWPVAFCDTRQQREGPNGAARMANAAFIVAAVNYIRSLESKSGDGSTLKPLASGEEPKEREPGIGWQLSDEARERIRQLEEAQRVSAHNARNIIVGSAASGEEPSEEEVQKEIADVIERAVKAWRADDLVDEDGVGLGLADLLATPKEKAITWALKRQDALIDYIQGDVLAFLASRQLGGVGT